MTLAWRRGRLLLLRFQCRLLWHVLLAPTWLRHVLLAPTWLWQKSLRDPGAMKASAPPFTATTTATGGWSEPSESDQSPHSLSSLHPQQPLWPCIAWLGKGIFESHFQPGSSYSALESATKMKNSSQMGSPHYVQHHSQQEAAAKQDQTPGNVSEKLMETGASVTLLSHLTAACGESSLGMDLHQSQRHTKSVSPAALPFSLQTWSSILWISTAEREEKPSRLFLK